MMVSLRNVGRTIPDTASVNGKTFQVLPQTFWIQFNRGEWEPDLNRFFSNYVDSSKTVLDIGAWQGASLFTALSWRPKRVIAIEANPETFNLLKTNCELNHLKDVVDLHSCCIADKTGNEETFGPMDTHVEHSSINGIGGSGSTVKTISFSDFLEGLNLSEINIIKIDIEGGERFLTGGLNSLSGVPDTSVYLAMHPPFWPDKRTVAKDFMGVCKRFDLFDSKERVLPPETLWEWMMSDEKTIYPQKTGLFFDIILKSKQ